jgi:hypothetical protein
VYQKDINFDFIDEDDDDEASISDGNQQTNERTVENDDDKQNDENSPSASSGQPVSRIFLVSFPTLTHIFFLKSSRKTISDGQ